MKKLLSEINSIPDSIHNRIQDRLYEFRRIRYEGEDKLFLELCFCFLTANYDAAKSIRIHEAIGTGFLELSEEELSKKLKSLGYRFPNLRAKYAVEARRHKDYLYNIIYPNKKEFTYEDEHNLRVWIDKNIKGIGYKEASHFLRNVGYNKLAIVDFHIMDILVEHQLMEPYKSRSLSKQRYVEIEKVIHKLGKKANMDMAKLDYCLWYIETGKVLK